MESFIIFLPYILCLFLIIFVTKLLVNIFRKDFNKAKESMLGIFYVLAFIPMVYSFLTIINNLLVSIILTLAIISMTLYYRIKKLKVFRGLLIIQMLLVLGVIIYVILFVDLFGPVMIYS
ncbi:hypothetical protein E3U55_08500 [Filobacillus milosensis]|uniref:Uncharacterized protein n=1 Tax=Filobacillus milosensis TaxID=94137 RepID=A0A4Y8IMP5_9BACI|nr:hypothetical protein [Filobacillus milosensis]TFB21345.1 hypothetical protein E3U55_08500 [Filobacillus milosensis]